MAGPRGAQGVVFETKSGGDIGSVVDLRELQNANAAQRALVRRPVVGGHHGCYPFALGMHPIIASASGERCQQRTEADADVEAIHREPSCETRRNLPQCPSYQSNLPYESLR